MDCRDFEDRLEAFEAGLLPPQEKARACEHVHACPYCRALLEAIRTESDVLEPEAGDSLTLEILRRTSGPVCPESERLLCDCVDGTLETEEQEIVSLHLAHCPNCSGLAETLVELSEVLPGLATLEPDARFTGDVLRATSVVGRIPPKFNPRAWWDQLMRRPRFAWEAAYLGTLLLLLALGNPAILPKASAVPRVLTERSDRLLQETTSVLADRRAAAGQTLSDLRLKGRALWDGAAALKTQTISAFQRGMTSVLEQLRSEFMDSGPSEPSRNDLR